MIHLSCAQQMLVCTVHFSELDFLTTDILKWFPSIPYGFRSRLPRTPIPSSLQKYLYYHFNFHFIKNTCHCAKCRFKIGYIHSKKLRLY